MAWLTVDDVKAHLGIEPADTFDDVALEQAVDATVAYVDALPVAAGTDPDTWAPPADVKLGAVMLAARWYRRRNSPEGLASFGDLGATTVPPLDRDVERLLRIGRYAPPRVG